VKLAPLNELLAEGLLAEGLQRAIKEIESKETVTKTEETKKEEETQKKEEKTKTNESIADEFILACGERTQLNEVYERTYKELIQMIEKTKEACIALSRATKEQENAMEAYAETEAMSMKVQIENQRRYKMCVATKEIVTAAKQAYDQLRCITHDKHEEWNEVSGKINKLTCSINFGLKRVREETIDELKLERVNEVEKKRACTMCVRRGEQCDSREICGPCLDTWGPSAVCCRTPNIYVE
jgi:hypothetical protein